MEMAHPRRNHFATHRTKSQSAMEYLMTYGWAILIIAVVLGALYSLGVFNAVNFMPKVPGGGCHVFRPNDPGTSWNVNLVGSCNNALPQYVAQFNGQSSYINAGTNIFLKPNVFTLTGWVRYNRGQGGFVSFSGLNSAPGIALNYSSGHTLLEMGTYDYRYFSTTNPVNYVDGSWHFVSFIVTGNGQADISNSIMYVDGQQEAVVATSSSSSSSTMTGPFVIGAEFASYFNGSIANVQVYNTSLTANQVAYLYNEGIGGVPTSPQYLVGWWPLNGDANDYSGNNNNGVPTAVTFNGTWTSGYNVP